MIELDQLVDEGIMIALSSYRDVDRKTRKATSCVILTYVNGCFSIRMVGPGFAAIRNIRSLIQYYDFTMAVFVAGNKNGRIRGYEFFEKITTSSDCQQRT